MYRERERESSNYHPPLRSSTVARGRHTASSHSPPSRYHCSVVPSLLHGVTTASTNIKSPSPPWATVASTITTSPLIRCHGLYHYRRLLPISTIAPFSLPAPYPQKLEVVFPISQISNSPFPSPCFYSCFYFF